RTGASPPRCSTPWPRPWGRGSLSHSPLFFSGERGIFFPSRWLTQGRRRLIIRAVIERTRGEDVFFPPDREAAAGASRQAGERQAAPAGFRRAERGALGRGVPAYPGVNGAKRLSFGRVNWVVPRAFPSHSWGGEAFLWRQGMEMAKEILRTGRLALREM